MRHVCCSPFAFCFGHNLSNLIELVPNVILKTAILPGAAAAVPPSNLGVFGELPPTLVSNSARKIYLPFCSTRNLNPHTAPHALCNTYRRQLLDSINWQPLSFMPVEPRAGFFIFRKRRRGVASRYGTGIQRFAFLAIARVKGALMHSVPTDHCAGHRDCCDGRHGFACSPAQQEAYSSMRGSTDRQLREARSSNPGQGPHGRQPADGARPYRRTRDQS